MRIAGVVVVVVVVALTSCCLADLTSSLTEVVEVDGSDTEEEEVVLFVDSSENVTVIFPSEEPGRPRNPRKLLWYLSAFGILVAFLLAAVCAGCCCSQQTNRPVPTERNSCPATEIDLPPPQPPPPYHLFAPPPYDALLNPSGKQSAPVFVIPVQGSSVDEQA